MSISLSKKTGISLKKGSSINLIKKDGTELTEVCMGINWGVIKSSALFGLIKTNESVDLDGSVSGFDENGKEVYTVYYNKLRSPDGAIKHSGDDLVGDEDGDDGLDNEIIHLDLKKIDPNVKMLVFYINSYKGQDFSNIPYSKIRILEGNIFDIKDVFATFNLSSDEKFSGYVSMVLGKLMRVGSSWKFDAIGEPIKAKKIAEIIKGIERDFV